MIGRGARAQYCAHAAMHERKTASDAELDLVECRDSRHVDKALRVVRFNRDAELGIRRNLVRGPEVIRAEPHGIGDERRLDGTCGAHPIEIEQRSPKCRLAADGGDVANPEPFDDPEDAFGKSEIHLFFRVVSGPRSVASGAPEVATAIDGNPRASWRICLRHGLFLRVTEPQRTVPLEMLAIPGYMSISALACYNPLMSEKTIEVELRGPLTPEAYAAFREYLVEHGSLIAKQDRLLLDFSTFTEGVAERTLDVRVRVTNGKVEMVVKRGAFGGTSREEASLFPADNLASTLRFMSLLGYTKAVVCNRGIERFQIGEIEIALQDVRSYASPGSIYSRFFEAEIMATPESKDTAVETIRTFLKERSLIEFTPTEWSTYVETMNKEANGVYEYSADSARELSQSATL